MTTLQSGSAIIALTAPLGNKQLAQGNDNSNRNGTLPSPELNPLINPILGAHMGRWAEVYFTSPPEKRDEAVLELLRELQGGPSDLTPVTSLPDSSRLRPTEPSGESNPSKAAGEPEWAICESCGGRNELGNRFCGMCGAPLEQASFPHSETGEASERPKGMWGGTLAPNVDTDRRQNKWQNPNNGPGLEAAGIESDRLENGPRHESRQDEFHQRESGLRQADPYSNERREQELEAVHERFHPIEFASAAPQPQARPQNTWPSRPDVPSLIAYEEAPNRRRLYVGALVGIVMLGLVYVAWKGSSGASGASHTLPQAAPQSAEGQPAVTDQPPPPAPQAENVPPAAVKAPPVPARKPAATIDRAYHKPAADTYQTNAPAPTSEQAAGPIVASLQGNGSEELTVAEGYLNGTGGRARDTSEAAKWLWRSLSKKNGAAALLLSDLYVRGDGVPKSCDQARLLLDAATRKGVPGAGQRLQNLPSLGCQ